MKKPKPPVRPHECISDIDAYRRYALEQLTTYYNKICEELGNTDPETLEKLTAILAEYEEVEKHVDNALKLMKAEIQNFKNVLGDSENGALQIEPEISPLNGNLTFKLKVV